MSIVLGLSVCVSVSEFLYGCLVEMNCSVDVCGSGLILVSRSWKCMLD